MILLVDIGNSNIVIGVMKDDVIKHSWRIHTSLNQSVDEYDMLVRGMLFACDFSLEEVGAAVLSSVVPELTEVFVELIENLIAKLPITVNSKLNLGITINTDIPATIGQDRLVNAASAYVQYKTSLIVVDCGTATKLDVVTAEGVFQGGLICPGLMISAEALFSRAAQLFQVNLEIPKRLIGKNTTESIQSGLIHGHGGMINALITKMKEELKLDQQPEPKVVITGGLAAKILPMLPDVSFQEDLTLRGLYLIHQLNAK